MSQEILEERRRFEKGLAAVREGLPAPRLRRGVSVAEAVGIKERASSVATFKRLHAILLHALLDFLELSGCRHGASTITHLRAITVKNAPTLVLTS